MVIILVHAVVYSFVWFDKWNNGPVFQAILVFFYMSYKGGAHEDWHKTRPLVVTYVRPGGPADR